MPHACASVFCTLSAVPKMSAICEEVSPALQQTLSTDKSLTALSWHIHTSCSGDQAKRADAEALKSLLVKRTKNGCKDLERLALSTV